MRFEDQRAADIRDLLAAPRGSARLAAKLLDTEETPSPASSGVEGGPSAGTP
jgi:hypothetical protein